MEFYCSKCGTRLTHTRKALRNKMKIVDLIDPHECDDSNIDNITDSDTQLELFDQTNNEPEQKPYDPGDRRDPKAAIPKGILGQLDSLHLSNVRNPDFDED